MDQKNFILTPEHYQVIVGALMERPAKEVMATILELSRQANEDSILTTEEPNERANET